MDKFRKELQRKYEAAKGVEKAIYSEVLALLPKEVAPQISETDMREKLIHLLYTSSCESNLEGLPGSCQYRRNGMCGEVDRLDYCAAVHLADHLIANGVTIVEMTVRKG